MHIYQALINALSTHMEHINLTMIFYTHVQHSPTKTIYIIIPKTKNKKKCTTNTHTHTDCSRNWVLILVRMEILWEEEDIYIFHQGEQRQPHHHLTTARCLHHKNVGPRVLVHSLHTTRTAAQLSKLLKPKRAVIDDRAHDTDRAWEGGRQMWGKVLHVLYVTYATARHCVSAVFKQPSALSASLSLFSVV